MKKLSLSKKKISELSSEFASFVETNYLESKDLTHWNNNDYLNLVDEHYEEFVLFVSGEGLIDEKEKQYLLSYDEDIDAYIKEDAIEELRSLLDEDN